jgi:hypothetical protein
MAVPNEYFLFRNYSLAVKAYIQNKCYLTRYPRDENVLVVYGTPARAFAKYVYPIVNGSQVQPIISFHLSSKQYAENENLLGFQNEHIYNTGTQITKSVPPLLVYKLNYTLTLRTLTMSDMDILLYQILTTTSKNKKHWAIVEDQWMELGFNDVREETNLEPGEVQDRVIRYGIDLSVPRAYLPREYTEAGAIQSWQLNYEMGEVGDTL